MGAFGHGIFDDDVAYDIMDSLQNTSALSEDIEKYLEVVNTQDYLEYEEAISILVCTAVMDAVINDTNYRFDGFYHTQDQEEATGEEQLGNWLSRFTADELEDLRILAVKALKKVLTSSELQEVWSESPEYDDWVSGITDIMDRLED